MFNHIETTTQRRCILTLKTAVVLLTFVDKADVKLERKIQ